MPVVVVAVPAIHGAVRVRAQVVLVAAVREAPKGQLPVALMASVAVVAEPVPMAKVATAVMAL